LGEADIAWPLQGPNIFSISRRILASIISKSLANFICMGAMMAFLLVILHIWALAEIQKPSSHEFYPFV